MEINCKRLLPLEWKIISEAMQKRRVVQISFSVLNKWLVVFTPAGFNLFQSLFPSIFFLCFLFELAIIFFPITIFLDVVESLYYIFDHWWAIPPSPPSLRKGVHRRNGFRRITSKVKIRVGGMFMFFFSNLSWMACFLIFPKAVHLALSTRFF